jgi:hypothetical protein
MVTVWLWPSDRNSRSQTDRVMFRPCPGRGIARQSRSDDRDPHPGPLRCCARYRALRTKSLRVESVGASRCGLESSSPRKPHEILLRLPASWIATTDGKPSRTGITQRFLRSAASANATMHRVRRSQRDCPCRDRPASMAAGFQGKHHTGERLQGRAH